MKNLVILILRYYCLRYKGKLGLLYVFIIHSYNFYQLKVSTIVLTSTYKAIHMWSPYPLQSPIFYYLPIASSVFFEHTEHMPTFWPCTCYSHAWNILPPSTCMTVLPDLFQGSIQESLYPRPSLVPQFKIPPHPLLPIPTPLFALTLTPDTTLYFTCLFFYCLSPFTRLRSPRGHAFLLILFTTVSPVPRTLPHTRWAFKKLLSGWIHEWTQKDSLSNYCASFCVW